jgi:hypothetical protein
MRPSLTASAVAVGCARCPVKTSALNTIKSAPGGASPSSGRPPGAGFESGVAVRVFWVIVITFGGTHCATRPGSARCASPSADTRPTRLVAGDRRDAYGAGGAAAPRCGPRGSSRGSNGARCQSCALCADLAAFGDTTRPNCHSAISRGRRAPSASAGYALTKLSAWISPRRERECRWSIAAPTDCSRRGLHRSASCQCG